MQKTRRIISLMATFVMAMMIFVGCSSKPTTMQDREGNEFNVPTQVNTIISTAPSNTEVLVALGLADKLVAVDKYSA
ncbi:MAG: ABC transporter substrate-binding protein, partial [Clostridium celatum]|nr:ABC transporter substrate-binding protein [Clostridium celatum]